MCLFFRGTILRELLPWVATSVVGIPPGQAAAAACVATVGCLLRFAVNFPLLNKLFMAFMPKIFGQTEQQQERERGEEHKPDEG